MEPYEFRAPRAHEDSSSGYKSDQEVLLNDLDWSQRGAASPSSALDEWKIDFDLDLLSRPPSALSDDEAADAALALMRELEPEALPAPPSPPQPDDSGFDLFCDESMSDLEADDRVSPPASGSSPSSNASSDLDCRPAQKRPRRVLERCWRRAQPRPIAPRRRVVSIVFPCETPASATTATTAMPTLGTGADTPVSAPAAQGGGGAVAYLPIVPMPVACSHCGRGMGDAWLDNLRRFVSFKIDPFTQCLVPVFSLRVSRDQVPPSVVL